MRDHSDAIPSLTPFEAFSGLNSPSFTKYDSKLQTLIVPRLTHKTNSCARHSCSLAHTYSSHKQEFRACATIVHMFHMRVAMLINSHTCSIHLPPICTRLFTHIANHAHLYTRFFSMVRPSTASCMRLSTKDSDWLSLGSLPCKAFSCTICRQKRSKHTHVHRHSDTYNMYVGRQPVMQFVRVCQKGQLHCCATSHKNCNHFCFTKRKEKGYTQQQKLWVKGGRVGTRKMTSHDFHSLWRSTSTGLHLPF